MATNNIVNRDNGSGGCQSGINVSNGMVVTTLMKLVIGREVNMR